MCAFFNEINPLWDLWNALRAWNTLRVWNALRRVKGFISFHIEQSEIFHNSRSELFHIRHRRIFHLKNERFYDTMTVEGRCYYIYAPFHCSMTKKNELLSTRWKFVFFIFIALFRANQGKIKEKYAKSHAAAVNRTVVALFLCPQQRQNGLYFLSFFAQIKNSKKIASWGIWTFGNSEIAQKIIKILQKCCFLAICMI